MNNFTLPAGLAFFQGGSAESATQYGPLTAGAALAVVPTIVIFITAQKYVTRGITMSGLKY